MNASNLGDISADDNAVDIPIKNGDEGTGIGLSNNANERIPILDDDDDVIVLPQEEPIITEIPDDDDHEAKDESAAKQLPNSQGVGLENRDSDVMAMSQDTGVVSQSDSERGRVDANDEGLLIIQLSFI